MKRPQGSQPNNPDASTPQSGPLPSVDAYFDRELTPDSIESLLTSLRRSRAERRKFDDTQSMLDDLRTPIQAPDVTAGILGEVGDRRGWLSSGQRRLVFAGRLATAACLLLVVTGLLVIRRNNPEAFRTADATGPVSEVVEAGGSEAGAGLRAISDGLRTLERRCEPAVAMAASSVSTCQSACNGNARYTASASQDYSMPLSPGVGQWLSASNVRVVVVVSNGAGSAARSAGRDASINRWLIIPDQGNRLPSYDATAVASPRLINAADWTALSDRGR